MASVELNDLGTRGLDAPDDLGSTGTRHDNPVGILHLGLELTAAPVLKVEGVEVGQKKWHTDAMLRKGSTSGNAYNPIRWQL